MEPAAGLIVSELPPPSLGFSHEPTTDGLPRAQSVGKGDNVIAATTVSGDRDNTLLTSPQVSIYCIYSSNPGQLIPNSTRWFKNGHLLDGVIAATSQQPSEDELNDPDTSEQHIKSNHLVESFTATGYPVLTINQVTRYDAGFYDCQVRNSVGQSERLPTSDSCKLEVNFRPRVQLRLYRAIAPKDPQQFLAGSYALNELIEVDVSQELVMPGGHFVLLCDVLEAQPNNVDNYYWFKRGQPGSPTRLNNQQRSTPAPAPAPTSTSTSISKLVASSQVEPQLLINKTDSGQLALGPLPSNYTWSSFACAASNSLGPSEQSNKIELQLSYTPGKFAFFFPLIIVFRFLSFLCQRFCLFFACMICWSESLSVKQVVCIIKLLVVTSVME